MPRKRVVIPLVFVALLAVPPMIYSDYVPYSWWIFYEAAIHGRHYDRCWWPDDIIGPANTTSIYDFEYDEELDCHMKDRPRGETYP